MNVSISLLKVCPNDFEIKGTLSHKQSVLYPEFSSIYYTPYNMVYGME